jgi:hypothetical protein
MLPNSTEKIDTNPFRMGKMSRLFGFKEAQMMKERRARSQMMSMTLVERNSQLKPAIPPLHVPKNTGRNTVDLSSSKILSYSTRAKEKQQRCMRMTEFIQQKREIYQVQLLIDRKRKEIEKVNNEIKSKEDGFKYQEVELYNLAQRYKILTAKIEEELAKGRKDMEIAVTNRVGLQKKLKRRKLAIEIITSELSKNEDLLEHYTRYGEFLAKFPNPNLYDSPNNLIQEFTDIEQENLFLIKRCEEFRFTMDAAIREPMKLLAEAEKAFVEVSGIYERRKSTLFEMEAVREEPVTIDSEAVDIELNSLAEQVSKTHYVCFNVKADLSPLAMLEKIENTLEDFYKRLEWVSPHFINAKQAKFDRERREALRIAAQREKEMQQQEKKDQALERARKPIKRKTGRPVVQRSVPFRFIRQKNTMEEKLLAEQKATEELLFGLPK